VSVALGGITSMPPAERARHNGHLYIAREMLDGTTGH